MVNKKELVRKGFIVGAGIAAIAKEKTDKVVAEMLKKGHISQAEGKKLVRSVVAEAVVSGKRVAKVLESELSRMVKVAGAASTTRRVSKHHKRKSRRK